MKKWKPNPRKAVRVALVCVMAFALPLGIAWFAGLRINNTPSLPLGIWRRVGEAPSRGDFVMVRVDASPVFRDGINDGVFSLRTPLMKRLAALPGDSVEVSAVGVSVNGVLWKNTAPSPSFRPPAQGGIVPEGMCWVLSDYHPASYDSRYFGPIPLTHITGQIRPLLTWDAQNRSEASRLSR